MTHTPGPWKVGKFGDSVVTNNPIEGAFAGADAADYYGGNLICESATSANARLIAQAPELLWLVESFIALYPINEACTAIQRILLDKAKDTIEVIKVEGVNETADN